LKEVTLSDRTAITVTLNGKPREVALDQTLSGLLKELDLRERLVVVERNGLIVNRADFPTTSLAAGDILEIVHFVGGG
jgi:thiamine biosynthesis protein ThiS